MRSVLIVDAAVGGGHRSVAEAIAHAVRARLGERVVVHRTDAFASGRWPARHAEALYALAIVRLPLLWRLAYAATDNPAARAGDALLTYLLAPSLRGSLATLLPDLVLTTVPVVGPALASARAHNGHRAPWLTMLTDLGHAHATWFAPRVAQYLAPSGETYVQCRARGVAAERVCYTGLPVRPAFLARWPDPASARARLGRPAERVTALVLGGAAGAGPTLRLVQMLAHLAPDVQQVVVCGHNDRLRRSLAALRLPSVVVLGYVSDVARLMAAADLIVTKAGASTTAEALVMGRPLVISSALPGQEEANACHLARHHAAAVALGAEPAARAVARLAASAEERAAIVARARLLAVLHAHAADAVARLVAGWLGEARAGAGEIPGSAQPGAG